MIFTVANSILITFILAIVFAFVAILLLQEYRCRLRTDLNEALSIEVLRQCIASAGAAGYIASGLLFASAICLLLDVIVAASAAAPFLNLLE